MAEVVKPRTFAEKLDHLFLTVHPRGRRPYSLEEVAAGIAKQGYEPVSAAYIWALRRGQRDNPTIKTVEALSRFFGVPTGYFFDDVLAGRVDAELGLLSSVRQAGNRSLAERVDELSPEGRSAVAAVLDIACQAVAKTVEAVSDLDRARPVTEREA